MSQRSAAGPSFQQDQSRMLVSYSASSGVQSIAGGGSLEFVRGSSYVAAGQIEGEAPVI